ncbi:alpha/beta hydrolase [Nitrogeniibacter mangrovi]|uniref:Alpha/beta hydrolase n=1 Tax=Nitrogeniibacter mangrovi TaxID=2016596 RepID=A0A6C1B631_9RHOO|nr:alpha/beta hydrolase [Nitrogeniibacter mangrovi]QID19172.1 alpha/beta hydrolase [Nitrogeniibacter mangrovi]
MARLTRDNLRHWALCASIATHLDDLRALHCPTDLVCGTRSNDVAHAIVRHLHGALPDSTCHEIDGASHFMVTTHPEACLEILREPR